MEKEIWLPVVGYEWLYEVSNLGRIKSSYRKCRLLKWWIQWSWYFWLWLYKNGIWKYFQIHRLKALAHIPNPENKLCVGHRDNNPLNNWMNEDWKDNLYWCTSSENNKYIYECWRRTKPMLWRFWKDCPNSKKVNQYTLDWKFIRERWSTMDIQRKLWFNNSSISACARWKYKQMSGFIRKYKNGTD